MQMIEDNYDINDPANNDMIVSESMDNMFNIITKRETYDSIVKANGRVLMTFNPLKETPIVDDLIDDLIDYYSGPDVEMYERCAELVRLKKSDNKSMEGMYDSIEFEMDWGLDNNDR